MTKEESKALVDKVALELGEHFESVRIFVTLSTDDGKANTVGIDSGCGNLYSQLGQVQEWLCVQDQYTRDWATRNDPNNKSSE